MRASAWGRHGQSERGGYPRVGIVDGRGDIKLYGGCGRLGSALQFPCVMCSASCISSRGSSDSLALCFVFVRVDSPPWEEGGTAVVGLKGTKSGGEEPGCPALFRRNGDGSGYAVTDRGTERGFWGKARGILGVRLSGLAGVCMCVAAHGPAIGCAVVCALRNPVSVFHC